MTTRQLSVRSTRGFTLIELLVVIASIGLLATIELAALNVARSKARETARLAEMKQIANALELYNNDHNQYPIPGSGSGWAAINACGAPYVDLKGAFCHWYRVENNGQGYVLYFQFENPQPNLSQACYSEGNWGGNWYCMSM